MFISFKTSAAAYKCVRNNTHYNPKGIHILLQHAPTFISAHITLHPVCLFVHCLHVIAPEPPNFIFDNFTKIRRYLWPKVEINNDALHEMLSGLLWTYRK